VSPATCVAYFAGQYLERHDVSRTGLAVHAEHRKTDRPPARVATINLRVIVPVGLPGGRVKPLHAVVSRCTVHNTLREPPTSTSRSMLSPFWCLTEVLRRRAP
jgi:putative redox protein